MSRYGDAKCECHGCVGWYGTTLELVSMIVDSAAAVLSFLFSKHSGLKSEKIPNFFFNLGNREAALFASKAKIINIIIQKIPLGDTRLQHTMYNFHDSNDISKW